jgi:hypothetical protein
MQRILYRFARGLRGVSDGAAPRAAVGLGDGQPRNARSQQEDRQRIRHDLSAQVVDESTAVACACIVDDLIDDLTRSGARAQLVDAMRDARSHFLGFPLELFCRFHDPLVN